VLSVPRPPAVTPVRLSSLIPRAGEGSRVRGADVAVAGVAIGSRSVLPGDLFVAAPGRRAHGAAFAADAAAAGAVAVLTDADGAALLPPDLPAIVCPDVRAAAGPVAARVYGDPAEALGILGVTGTSGKTTTTFFLRAGLQAEGRFPALIGTVATLIGDDSVSTGFTTPEAPDVQALLAVMRERGVTDVAMEVSSHALRLGRVGGISFAVGGFTNLSEEHLDFHTSMEDYFDAKAALFDASRHAVVVIDDAWGRRLADRLAARGVPLTTVAATPGSRADWTVETVEVTADGRTAFRAVGPGGAVPAGCAVPGSYNVTNVLVALAMLDAHGVPPAAAAPAIAQATVPGRMERIDAGQPFLAVVDYSHKPAAVAGALAALRPLTAGRLIIVLGCGGDRDTAKRPVMGEIAARDADLFIVTDDNPRSEDPAAIRRAMLDGASRVAAAERAEVVEVGDRRAAIAAALATAGPGDTVLVAGKGHETGQEIAGVVTPFDDREVLRGCLTGAGSAPRSEAPA
jgi:UDP-N-acetylmuramoyl-L-alanyl-D-glutamate--2,6-diaminopimelate ligase